MKIFLSYDSEKRALAYGIYNNLKNEGYDVFFDKINLEEGDTYDQRIIKAIQESDLFLFLMTCRSVENRNDNYTMTELRFAYDRWVEGEIIILPICIENIKKQLIPDYIKNINFFTPAGDAAAEVLAKVSDIHEEKNAWEKAEESNTIKGFQDYNKNNPDGRYKRKALEKIKGLEELEDSVWQNAKTIPAYKQYLTDYPQGRYVEKARGLIQKKNKKVWISIGSTVAFIAFLGIIYLISHEKKTTEISTVSNKDSTAHAKDSTKSTKDSTVPDKNYTIQIEVNDKQGRPIQGAKVVATGEIFSNHPQAFTKSESGSFYSLTRTFTDSIAKLPITIIASSTNYQAYTSIDSLADFSDGRPKKITLNPVKKIDYLITIRVNDAQTGQPITSARFEKETGGRSLVTDAESNYYKLKLQLTQDDAKKSISLVSKANGYISSTKEIVPAQQKAGNIITFSLTKSQPHYKVFVWLDGDTGPGSQKYKTLAQKLRASGFDVEVEVDNISVVAPSVIYYRDEDAKAAQRVSKLAESGPPKLMPKKDGPSKTIKLLYK